MPQPVYAEAHTLVIRFGGRLLYLLSDISLASLFYALPSMVRQNESGERVLMMDTNQVFEIHNSFHRTLNACDLYTTVICNKL